MLQIKNIALRFGGLEVLRDVSFEVEQGDLVGLIGPNGAGKTSLFNIVSGFLRPAAGDVLFEGASIVGMPTHKLAARGLVRTFQGARIFPKLTVSESLRISRHLERGTSDSATLSFESGVLETFGLVRYEHEMAGTLPSGLMRVLGIAMAINTGAKMLLLDEPAAGLNPDEVDQLQKVIREVNRRSVTICVIEHNLHFLMGLVGRACVLDAGVVIADGPPAQITQNPAVIEAYLGSETPC